MKTAPLNQASVWSVAPGALGRALHYNAAPRLYARTATGGRRHPVRCDVHAAHEHPN